MSDKNKTTPAATIDRLLRLERQRLQTAIEWGATDTGTRDLLRDINAAIEWLDMITDRGARI